MGSHHYIEICFKDLRHGRNHTRTLRDIEFLSSRVKSRPRGVTASSSQD